MTFVFDAIEVLDPLVLTFGEDSFILVESFRLF